MEGDFQRPEDLRDSAEHDVDVARLQDDIPVQQPAAAQGDPVLAQNNVVILPAGTEIAELQSQGEDLIIILTNGERIVVPDGAIIVPAIVVDGVTLPAANVAALLIGNEPEPAGGQAQSSGGNFYVDPGNIQAAYGLGDLLPYTELNFPQPEERELIPPYPLDDDPDIGIITPDNPAAVTNASAEVDEAGLPARGGEPAGTDAASNSETTTGTIVYATPDGFDSITINGVTITSVGQTIQGDHGVMTITSIEPGRIGYSYTLTDNLIDAGTDFFAVVVTETDGSRAEADLTVRVVDDAPIARDDTDTVPAGSYDAQSGNVMTGSGTDTGAAGADEEGADGATLTMVDGQAVSAGGSVVIQGLYGVLTISSNGSYTYVRDAGTPGGVEESFDYTLTDGDGSTDSATLTIVIADSPVVITNIPVTGAGTVVDESGLPARPGEAPGTQQGTDLETNSGTITFTSPDGPAVVTIGGVVVTGPGQVIPVTDGTLTIVDYDPVTGTIDYSFTLDDNVSGDDVMVTIPITVTDQDGDTATTDLVITIIDDAPVAVDDSATQASEDAAITVDAFANDIQGADSVQFDAIALVDGTLSGGGTVTYNGDGTFTYTPAPGEEGQVTFDYTITDGDGDTSTATVTIDLLGDSTPTISLTGDNDVREDALGARGIEPEGSDAASDAETAIGTINIATGGDSIARLLVDGVDVTNGGTVTTAKGVLTVTLANGTYSYSYELTDNTLSDPDSDSFRVTVVDSDGDRASTTLTMAIVDDVPTAMDDSATQGSENAPVTVDVFANDVQGADGVTFGDIAAVPGTLTGAGTLTYNADGTFIYAPAPGEEGQVSFDYTVTDGDGDTSTATVTIDLLGDSTPTIAVTGDNDVREDALGARGSEPAGSDSASNAEFATGSIALDKGGDSVARLVINGVNVTNGGTVTTAKGVLTVTLANGTYSYSYELTDNTLTDPDSDSFSLTVIDSDGDRASTSLVIAIVDDAPSAVDDANSIAAGQYGPVGGNVIANDTVGADDAEVTAFTGAGGSGSAGDTVQGQYGVLTLNADGSYAYIRDAGTPGGVSDTFQYTITDSDGDPASASLVIAIADSPTTLNVPVAGDGGTEVDESGLASGSQPGTDGEFTSGTITYTAPDGPATITIGGVTVSAVGDTVTGQYGILTVTGIANGTISYTYELTTNTDGDNTFDRFRVVITDQDGDRSAGNLDIAIVDDVPSAADDFDTVPAGTYDPVSGNVLVNDIQGADDALVVSFTGVGSGNAGDSVQGAYGVLTLNADGSYTYVRDPGTPGGVTDVFTYTIEDGDGDQSIATLNIDIDDSPTTIDVPTAGEAGTMVDEAGLDGPPATSSPAEGSAAGSNAEFTSGTVTFTAPDGPATVSIGGTDLAVGTVVQGIYGTLTITAITGGSVSYTYELTSSTTGDTTSDEFTFTVTDQDGDFSQGTLTIAIEDDTPVAANDFDSVPVGSYDPISGNVITNDTTGADDASVLSFSGVNGSGQPGDTIQGQYGTLMLNADGSYTYTRDPGSPGGVQDAFDYTIVDGDGDTASAVLTISVADSPVTLDVPTAGEAGTMVDEAGLDGPPNGADEGSDAALATETTAGTITYTAPDGPGVVTIDGVAVTAVGQTFTGSYGTLTITSIANGSVGYSYTLTTNTSGDATFDDFAVRVTDQDGDFTDGTLTIAIEDDVPTALDDTDAVAAGTYFPETGNVLTGNGTTSGAAGDDVEGADGVVLTGYFSVSQGGTAPAGTVLQGEYGTLTMYSDGSYVYIRDQGTPGGVQDEFLYTIRDGDGDLAGARLTITIGDSTTTLDVPTAGEAGTMVDEAGLDGPPNGADEGSDAALATETTAGTITYTAPDGPGVVTIDGVAVTAVGQTFTGSYGTLTITSIANGSVGYSYTLTTNTSGDATFDDFAVRVTDQDGDFTDGTLTIAIEDDVPTALDDTDAVAAGTYFPETGNVLTGNGTTSGAAGDDVEGADGVVLTGYFSVSQGGTAPAGTVLQGEYGTLTMYSDGSYVYIRDQGTPGGVQDEFLYTIRDGDGDLAGARLTITIGDSTTTLDVPTAGEAGTMVDEAGLDGPPNGADEGSDAALATETTAGTITYTAPDGPGVVTIDGVAVTAVGQTFTGSYGTLTITSIANGSVGYSYTLTTNTSGDATFDDFAVRVTDQDGDFTDGTLTIAIEDDVPTALDDTDAVAAGTYFPETGNVLTGNGTTSGAAGDDVEGADGVVLTGYFSVSQGGTAPAGTVLQGEYGTLTMYSDGSYVYIRDQGTPGGVQDEFLYTIRDGDGDLAGARLTITIGDSTTTLDVPTAGEAGTMVDEAGLDGPPNGADEGSDAALATETTAGTITYTAPDGPGVVTIDGVAVTAVGQTFTGSYGTLTITSIANGSVGYSYTLTTNTSGDATSDDFAIRVTDQDGDFTDGTLTIAIEDDVPTAIADVDSVKEDTQLVADGNVLTGSGGTDGNATDGVADTQGADGATVTSVAFGATAGTVGGRTAGMYGTLELNADGSYTYLLDNIDPAVQALGASGTLTEIFSYTLTDGDGDIDDTTLTITIRGTNDAPTVGSAVIATSDEGLQYGNQDSVGNPSDTTNSTVATGSITISDVDNGDTLTITLSGPPSTVYSGGEEIVWTTSNGGMTLSGRTAISNTLVMTVEIGPDGSFDVVQSAQIDHGTANTEDVLPIQFGVAVSDGTVTSNSSITVNVEDDSPIAVAGSSTGLVDEDGLPYGNPLGPGDVPGKALTATGTVTNLFASGADVPLKFGFTGDVSNVVLTDSTGAPVTSNGVAVLYSISGGVLTATAGTTTVLTLSLNQAGTWMFTLQAPIDHPIANTEDDLTLDFGNLVQATDFDGDSVVATGSLAITVDDDTPVAIFPVDVTGGFANVAGNSITMSLDPNKTVTDATGADQPGKLIFGDVPGDDSRLDYQGQDVLNYVSADGTFMEGRAGAAPDGTGGTLVYRVELDQANNTYTFTLLRPVDNGSGTTFTNLTGVGSAGNPTFKIVENPGSTELLFTAINASTVNSDSDDVAVGGQFIDVQNPDAGLRVDFGQFTFVPKNGPTPATYAINGHEKVNAFSFEIDQISQGSTADIRLKAYDADDDKILSGDTGDVQDSITRVTVLDAAGNEIATYVRTPDGDPRTVDGNVAGVITFEADGSVLLENLKAGYSVATFTDDGYNRIEVLNAGTAGGTDGKFSLSHLAIGQTDRGHDVSTHWELSLTDADGDNVYMDDSIEIVISPATTAPVVLDLDGDGVEFIGMDAGVLYDYGDGLVSTAWAGADDGILARVTDSGLDIVFTDDAAGAKTDLHGLALAFDSNGDGALTAADAAWSEFAVWQDADSDGVADAGEVVSLDQLGINSIGLASDGLGYSDPSGDVLVYGRASYATNDNGGGALADASFDTAMRQSTTRQAEQAVTAAAAGALLAAFDVAAQEQVALASDHVRGPWKWQDVVAPIEEPAVGHRDSAGTVHAAPEVETRHAQELPETRSIVDHAPDEPVADTAHDAFAAHDAAPAFEPAAALAEAPAHFAAFDGAPGLDVAMMEALLAAATQSAPAAKCGVASAAVVEVVGDALAGSKVDAVVDAHAPAATPDGQVLAVHDAPAIVHADAGVTSIDLAAMVNGDGFAGAMHPGAEGMEDLAVLAASAA